MKVVLFIGILLHVAIAITAQNKEGRVVDIEGNPMNAVCIYIPELKQGILSGKDGHFRIVTDKQNYTLQLKHPEYKMIQYNVSENEVEIVVIQDSLFADHSEPEAKSRSKADSIIRKCMVKAPVYMNAVKQYKSYSYINGRLRLEDVHSIVDKIGHKLDNIFLSEYKDESMYHELYSKTEYFYPDTYKVFVCGHKGNIPQPFIEKGTMEMQNGSIYMDRFGKFISPLNMNTFSFYKFRYIGHYAEGGSVFHKIQVESKVKDPELFNGHLYIEDSTWAIAYAVLKSHSQGLEITTSISYNWLQEGVSMPVSYHNDITFSLIGTKGTINYYASIKYEHISDENVMPGSDGIRRSEITYDENAGKRDSVFWNKHRLQPLRAEQFVQIPDSVGLKRVNLSKYWLGRALIGGYMIGSDSTRFSLKYNGVKFIFRDYNYVDGFWLGNKFDIKYKVNRKTDVEAYHYIYYATARKRILGGSDINYNYNRKRKGQLNLNFGSRTEDFNNLSLTRYQNYFASLFLGENYNFFYQRDFVSATNNIHLNKKIKASVSLLIEKRSGLYNHTDFNILGRNNIKPNIFPDDRFDRTAYAVKLLYSPRSNFSITEALDMHINKVTPVFNIEYQEGFSSWQTNNSKYQKLKGGITHNIQLDYFNWIDYKIESGVFLSKGKKMHFADYQHFGASDLLLNLNSLFDSFLLLDNYELQTNRYWINLFLNYSGKYVCLKYIPFLQGKPFTENIHLKTLFTPDIKSYVETGYSISFNRYFGIGVFTSFLNTKAKDVGIRFSLNLRSLDFIQ